MRISIVGNSGSGKSTAAKRIERQLGIPRLELDSIRHQANWVELADDEFRSRSVAFMEANSSWVIDGNYGVVRPEVWARADTVIWLNPPKLRNMRQIISRTFSRAILRTELWNGNRERFANLLSLDPYKSMVVWTWTRHAVIEERYGAAMTSPEFAHLTFVRFRTHQAFDAWLSKQQT